MICPCFGRVITVLKEYISGAVKLVIKLALVSISSCLDDDTPDASNFTDKDMATRRSSPR